MCVWPLSSMIVIHRVALFVLATDKNNKCLILVILGIANVSYIFLLPLAVTCSIMTFTVNYLDIKDITTPIKKELMYV